MVAFFHSSPFHQALGNDNNDKDDMISATVGDRTYGQNR